MMIVQGDFLVHFMDIARDELAKRLDDISVEKLQVWVWFYFLFTKWLVKHLGLIYLFVFNLNWVKNNHD